MLALKYVSSCTAIFQLISLHGIWKTLLLNYPWQVGLYSLFLLKNDLYLIFVLQVQLHGLWIRQKEL